MYAQGEPFSTPEMEHSLRRLCLLENDSLSGFLPQVGITPVASKWAKQGNPCAAAYDASKIKRQVVPPEFRIEKVRELIGLGVDVSAPDKVSKHSL